MPIEITALTRAFRYGSLDLADPAPEWNLEQVRDFWANTYPEIVSAAIEGPEEKGGKLVYTFRRPVGTKGSQADDEAKVNDETFRRLVTDPARLLRYARLDMPECFTMNRPATAALAVVHLAQSQRIEALMMTLAVMSERLGLPAPTLPVLLSAITDSLPLAGRPSPEAESAIMRLINGTIDSHVDRPHVH